MSEFNESNVLEIAEMLKTATENVDRVYAAGYSEGMKSEYDAFWDDYQDNGNTQSNQHFQIPPNSFIFSNVSS